MSDEEIRPGEEGVSSQVPQLGGGLRGGNVTTLEPMVSLTRVATGVLGELVERDVLEGSFPGEVGIEARRQIERRPDQEVVAVLRRWGEFVEDSGVSFNVINFRIREKFGREIAMLGARVESDLVKVEALRQLERGFPRDNWGEQIIWLPKVEFVLVTRTGELRTKSREVLLEAVRILDVMCSLSLSFAGVNAVGDETLDILSKIEAQTEDSVVIDAINEVRERRRGR